MTVPRCVCVCESEGVKGFCQALRCGIRGQLLLIANINIIPVSTSTGVCLWLCILGRPGFCSYVKDVVTVCCGANSTLETVSKRRHRWQWRSLCLSVVLDLL